MKVILKAFALLGGLMPSDGEEAAPQWNVEIPVTITDGRQSPATPKAAPIDFEVLNSHTKWMEVTEAAEMSDLPPIKGTIKVTVQTVADPGLPEPPVPLPALPSSDPAVIARMKELRKSYRGTEAVFISASVYDQSRTLLRIYPNGNVKGEITAWSNVDFNHFSGFSSFRVNNEDGTFREYGLLMGIGIIDTYRMRQRLAKHGHDYELPEVPDMPDLASGGPSFLVIGGQTDGEAMDTLAQVHDFYRKEGVRMEEAFHAREKARAARKAYLLANPQVPEDIVIRFWQRDQSGK